MMSSSYGGGMVPPEEEARARAALLQQLAPKSSPYEAPEAHPGAGGVTGGNVYNPTTNPGGKTLPPGIGYGHSPDVFYGSEGPGGLSGHNQDPGGLRISKVPVAAPPPVVNPGGQTMPTQAKAYGVTSGYDTGKLNDPNYHSPKYDLGRITNDIGLQSLMTPEGQQQLQQRLAANPYYKDVRVKGDKIMYTGQRGQPVTIDYIQGMNSGHPNLNYLTSDKGSVSGAMPSMPTLPTQDQTTMPIRTAMPTQDSAFFKNLMDRLNSNPEDFQKMMQDPRVAQLLQSSQDPNRMRAMDASATNRDAMLRLLGGQS